MKKLMLLFTTLFLLSFASSGLAALEPPALSSSTDGLDITLDWTSVPEATGYKLYYVPVASYTGSESVSSLDLGASTIFNYTLWDGASFYLAVTAYNDQESSPYSNIKILTIEVVPVLPSAPELSVTTSGLDLTLSWDAVSDATGYILNYAPTSSYPEPESFITKDVGDTSFHAVLWDGAAFTVAVQAYNDQGESDYSNIESFIMEEPRPKNLTISEISSALSFDVIKNDNEAENSIISDLHLPTTFMGATVTWLSTAESIITPLGNVNRDDFNNVQLALAATVEYENQSNEVVFTLTVRGKQYTVPTNNGFFSDNLHTYVIDVFQGTALEGANASPSIELPIDRESSTTFEEEMMRTIGFNGFLPPQYYDIMGSNVALKLVKELVVYHSYHAGFWDGIAMPFIQRYETPIDVYYNNVETAREAARIIEASSEGLITFREVFSPPEIGISFERTDEICGRVEDTFNHREPLLRKSTVYIGTLGQCGIHHINNILHELAHALGYSSHTAIQDTTMTVGGTWNDRIAAEGEIDPVTVSVLKQLYSLPAGTPENELGF